MVIYDEDFMHVDGFMMDWDGIDGINMKIWWKEIDAKTWNFEAYVYPVDRTPTWTISDTVRLPHLRTVFVNLLKSR